MAVVTGKIRVKTRGNCQCLDITSEVARCIAESGLENGIVTPFVIGSTASLTTTEFEPGLATHDIQAFFDKVLPENAYYKHEETWHDDNGHSHMRASLIGPSLTVPFVGGQMSLGTWQQIILLDFDTRPRDRVLVVQIIGE